MTFATAGIHHVTAITSDQQRNLDFYPGVLGLRLVKRTVNFDDPTTYHFYFGDESGNPGSLITFFAWPGAKRGRPGAGQVGVTSFAIPPRSLGYWIERLIRYHVQYEQPQTRFDDERVIALKDPDGLLLELSPDASILSPRGKVLENGAPRFFRRLAEGVFDLEDVRFRAGELAAFIECAVEEYQLAGAQVIAVGYSNGANIAAATMLLHPGRIHAGAFFRAMVVLEPSPLPELSGSAVCLSSGVMDPIVPASHVTRLAEIFCGAGASVELKQQQASHGLVQSDIFDCRDWLARIVKR